MARKPFIDESVLKAALIGLDVKNRELDQRILAIRQQLGESGAGKSVASEAPGKRKHFLSAAARKNIAEATRKLWAAYRKAKRAGK